MAVRDRRSQFIYVMGAVQRPGAHQITRETFLIDALSLAGGLTEKAGTHVQVYRAAAPAPAKPLQQSDKAPAPEPGGGTSADKPQEDAIEIDLTDLLEKGDISRNIPIFSRDMVTVKERQDKYFYVLGDVPKAGAYLWPPADGMTLSRALALAGGVLKSAAAGKTSVIRQSAGQELPNTTTVDAIAVMKGRIPDVEILENDVILVPGSMSKTIGRTFANSLSGLLSTILVIVTR